MQKNWVCVSAAVRHSSFLGWGGMDDRRFLGYFPGAGFPLSSRGSSFRGENIIYGPFRGDRVCGNNIS